MRTVIHHAGCPDGLTAAWLISRTGRARAVGHQHGSQLPHLPASAELWVVDLAFTPDRIDLWARTRERTIVLDHHATAARDHADRTVPLEDTLRLISDSRWKGTTITIDQNRSGCGLAAEAMAVLHPDMPAPEFILDVEDRDLWRWARPGSREVCFALEDIFQLESFPAVCAGLEKAARRSRDSLLEEGAELAETFDRTCAELAEKAEMHSISGHTVPLARIEDKRHASAVANLLLTLHPDAPFAGYWHVNEKDGRHHVGLRSDDSRADVSLVAEKHGGGGHRNAAGLAVDSLEQLR